ncbi:MAG: hypothetical protein GY870_06905 [archaeon]|nr:hypothetical protein [archaeon]
MGKKFELLNECDICGSVTEIRLYKQLFAWCPKCRTFRDKTTITNYFKSVYTGKKRKKRKIKVTNLDSIEELRSMPYDKYLRSSWWKKRRKAYYLKHSMICYCCGCKSKVLHHCCYERRGEEKDKDLVPLCECHHNFIHDGFLEEKGVTLKNAHKALKSMINLDNLYY